MRDFDMLVQCVQEASGQWQPISERMRPSIGEFESVLAYFAKSKLLPKSKIPDGALLVVDRYDSKLGIELSFEWWDERRSYAVATRDRHGLWAYQDPKAVILAKFVLLDESRLIPLEVRECNDFRGVVEEVSSKLGGTETLAVRRGLRLFAVRSLSRVVEEG